MIKKSLKKSLIQALLSLSADEEMGNHQLILTTAAGNICGNPVLQNIQNDDSNTSSIISHFCENVTNAYLKENPEMAENDGYIVLSDVRIRSTSGNVITNLPVMVIFYDQIIGASIGIMD